MGRSPLISFTGSPEDGDVSKHDSERGKRHYHGKKGARLFNHDWYCHTPFTWSHKLTCVKRKFCTGGGRTNQTTNRRWLQKRDGCRRRLLKGHWCSADASMPRITRQVVSAFARPILFAAAS